jgi:hypothetical protein
MKHAILVAHLLLLINPVMAQEKFFVEKDLQGEWLMYQEGYVPIGPETTRIGNTLYFKVVPGQYPGRSLVLKSARPFFLFFNGMLSGEYDGYVSLKVDSLAAAYFTPSLLVTVHQKNINRRDLKTWILSEQKKTSSLIPPGRPPTYFKDFVIVAGLTIIVIFLIIGHVNPKLASDYFSVIRIFSVREGDDAQSNARLASSTNIQFYIACSLLLGLYLMIIFHHLPDSYALPLHFDGHSFGAVVWQWIRLSMIILSIFFLKILFIFSLTRLFGLRGLARIHFFNWVRLLLIVFGGLSLILFIYYISRGQSPDFFVVFLFLIVGILMVWIGVVFLKLNGKSEHSMFHLFSYICATEIIPLLITIKVLFQ